MNATQVQGNAIDAARAGQAQLYAQFARAIEHGTFVGTPEGVAPIIEPRDLNIDEARTYVAALECLRKYFAGDDRREAGPPGAQC